MPTPTPTPPPTPTPWQTCCSARFAAETSLDRSKSKRRPTHRRQRRLMHDPEPQTAAGKVHFAFAMSLDGFVAGPGHTMEFLEGTTLRDGLLQEYIEATGAV